jgi:hypothetical protein
MPNKITAAEAAVAKQRRFKQRMYDQGYKQRIIWVKRDEENDSSKYPGLLNRRLFLSALDEFTAKFSKTKLSRLYNAILAFIKGGAWEK